MKISLKRLNQSMPSLKKAAESIVAGKLKYRFSRLLESATKEMELFGKSLADLAAKHGAEVSAGGAFSFDEDNLDGLKAFNKEAEEMMTSEEVEIWGDPEFFPFDELEKACAKDKPISADVLANILFLISEPKEETA